VPRAEVDAAPRLKCASAIIWSRAVGGNGVSPSLLSLCRCERRMIELEQIFKGQIPMFKSACVVADEGSWNVLNEYSSKLVLGCVPKVMVCAVAGIDCGMRGCEQKGAMASVCIHEASLPDAFCRYQLSWQVLCGRSGQKITDFAEREGDTPHGSRAGHHSHKADSMGMEAHIHPSSVR
jgi:hypothetical protein